MDVATVLKDYALPIVVMAIISCVLVGIVKSFIKPKKTGAWLSRLYILLALVAAFLCVMVYYLGITHGKAFKSWAFWKDVMLVYSCAQVIYQLYRKFGGRTLLLKAVALFKGRNKDLDAILAIIERFVDGAENVPDVAKEQVKAAITAEKVKAEINKIS